MRDMFGNSWRRISRAVTRSKLRLWQRHWGWALVTIALAALYGPTLSAHLEWSTSPWTLNDDARQQIVPFLRYAPDSPLPPEYITDYYLANLPALYRALFTAAGSLGWAIPLSKALPYLLLLLAVAGLGATAARIGGKAAAFGCCALALASIIWLSAVGGALPRSFAPPLIAWGLAALAYGRARLLALLVVVSAGFYPAAAVTLGLSLATLLIIVPSGDRGEASNWSPRRRMIVLAGTAAAAALMLVPTMIASAKFGPLIQQDQIADFPEAGPGGRYDASDRQPFDAFFEITPRVVRPVLVGSGTPWIAALKNRVIRGPIGAIGLEVAMLCLALAWIRLAWHQAEARRVLALGLAAFVAHVVARVFSPYFYLPQRYVLYPVASLAAVMWPTMIAGYLPQTLRLRHRQWAIGGASAGLLLLFGGRGHPTAGVSVHLPSEQRQLMAQIAKLPPSALVAGWPGGAVENVPYFARRNVLLSYETHQAFHLPYTRELRRRMQALVNGYLATSPQPLAELRDRYGVSHLVVDQAHLRTPPRYFRPFDHAIRAASNRAKRKGYELTRQLARISSFRVGRYALLDLRRLNE